MKRKPGRPTEKQAINRADVLWLALKMFAEKGFGGVSMTALAKECGMTDPNLYHHFGKKEDMWKSALTMVGDMIRDELDRQAKLIGHLDGIEQLRITFKQIVFISARYPEFQQIVVQEMFSKSERSRWLIETLLTPIYTHMDALRQAEQTAGRIKAYPAANLSSFIIGSITTLFSRSYQMETQYGVNPFDESEVAQHAELISDLLFMGMLTDQGEKFDT
ncbi:MAG: TetR/AcrR family transcriptional regulator [Bacteroidota bacterium]